MTTHARASRSKARGLLLVVTLSAVLAAPLRAAEMPVETLLERYDQACEGPRTLHGYFWRAAVRDPSLEPDGLPAADLVGGWSVQVDRELAVWRRGGQCYVDEVQRRKEGGRIVTFAARRWRSGATGGGADLEAGLSGYDLAAPRYEVLTQSQALPCLWGPSRAQITTLPQRPASRQLRQWGVRLAGRESCGALPDCYKLVFESVDPDSHQIVQEGQVWLAGEQRGYRQIRLERTLRHDPAQRGGIDATRIVDQVERLGQVNGHWVPLVTRRETYRLAAGRGPVLESVELGRVVELELDVDLTDWLFKPLPTPGAVLFGTADGRPRAGLSTAEQALETALFEGDFESLGIGPAPSSCL